MDLRDEDRLTTEELKEIHQADNAGGDCDCSFCREYRRRIKEDGKCQTTEKR
jgi:hypothetical protein